MSTVEFAPIDYANPVSSLHGVMADAEFVERIKPVGGIDDSKLKALLADWRQNGQVPILNPAEDASEQSDDFRLVRIAHKHERSFDVPKEYLGSTSEDISIKGISTIFPYPKHIIDSHSKYWDIWGGLVLRDALTAHKRSLLMQKRGIDFGEKILAIAKLREMPTKDGLKPTEQVLADFRNFSNYLPKRFPVGRRELQPVVMVRSMPNSYRVWDLRRGNRGNFSAMKVVGRSIQITGRQAPNLTEGLNPNSPEDCLLYLQERLPVIAGYSYGRLTEAGLKQIYGHAGNMSLSFGMPDADGVKRGKIKQKSSLAGFFLTEDLKEAVTYFSHQYCQTTVAFDNQPNYRDIFYSALSKGIQGKHPSEL